MARGILITNGGAHSPEKWAMATAEEIFQIDAVAGERWIEAKKLQTAIAEALVAHHDGAQQRERHHLHGPDADKRHAMTHGYTADRDEAVAEARAVVADIRKAAQGTPWADHWSRDDVAAAAVTVIAGDLMTNKHIERGWHRAGKPHAPREHKPHP